MNPKLSDEKKIRDLGKINQDSKKLEDLYYSAWKQFVYIC